MFIEKALPSNKQWEILKLSVKRMISVDKDEMRILNCKSLLLKEMTQIGLVIVTSSISCYTLTKFLVFCAFRLYIILKTALSSSMQMFGWVSRYISLGISSIFIHVLKIHKRVLECVRKMTQKIHMINKR